LSSATLHIEYNNHLDSVPQNELKSGIVKSLIYFDIFKYPLTKQEIIQYSPVNLTELSPVENALNELIEKIIIFRFGDYYSLRNDVSLTHRRRQGNYLAEGMLDKAKSKSRFISKFPFVRSVNISGSLSKNYFDSSSDFDFFIITSPNRIWLCRTLLALYKKIFLINSRKYFCINYFIDTEDLSIPDKNLFAATEIVTLKNQVGEDIYKSFIEANDWVSEFFPNFKPSYHFTGSNNYHVMKAAFEIFFSSGFGDWLDTCCFRLTLKFWKTKFPHHNQKEFKVNMRSKKHVSKHHPNGFQFKVLKAYEEKCNTFEIRHNMKLM
jgi:hypothetical protein